MVDEKELQIHPIVQESLQHNAKVSECCIRGVSVADAVGPSAATSTDAPSV